MFFILFDFYNFHIGMYSKIIVYCSAFSFYRNSESLENRHVLSQPCQLQLPLEARCFHGHVQPRVDFAAYGQDAGGHDGAGLAQAMCEQEVGDAHAHGAGAIKAWDFVFIVAVWKAHACTSQESRRLFVHQIQVGHEVAVSRGDGASPARFDLGGIACVNVEHGGK